MKHYFFFLIVQQMLNRMAQIIGTSESAELRANTSGEGFACALSSSMPCGTAPCQDSALPSPLGSTGAHSKNASGALCSVTEGERLPHTSLRTLPCSYLYLSHLSISVTPTSRKSGRHGAGEAGDSISHWYLLYWEGLLQQPFQHFGFAPCVLFLASCFCPGEEIFVLIWSRIIV